MKNKVIALIAAMTMAGSMMACGNAAASEPANADTAQANDAAPADTDTAAADNAA